MAAIVETEVGILACAPHHLQRLTECLGRECPFRRAAGWEKPLRIGCSPRFHVLQMRFEFRIEIHDAHSRCSSNLRMPPVRYLPAQVQLASYRSPRHPIADPAPHFGGSAVGHELDIIDELLGVLGDRELCSPSLSCFVSNAASHSFSKSVGREQRTVFECWSSTVSILPSAIVGSVHPKAPLQHNPQPDHVQIDRAGVLGMPLSFLSIALQ